MASTLTQRVSTIYIVDTGGLFFGHYSCLRLPHSLHFLNFHTFHASVICNFYSSRGNLFPVVDTFITDVSNFYFIALGIRPLHWSWWLVHLLCYLCEDSPSILWIQPLLSLLWFYPLFWGRFVYPHYRTFVSIVLVWIRPLLLIGLGFKLYGSLLLLFVLNFMNSSTVFEISPEMHLIANLANMAKMTILPESPTGQSTKQ